MEEPMKANKLIIGLAIGFISILSAGAQHGDGVYTITINDTKFKLELGDSLDGKIAGSNRFVTCENPAGKGFFWVDTRCGAVWWADPATSNWVYYGAPIPHQGRKNGRYIPYANMSGAGLFILDTDRGEGWWTNGQGWKKMGVPQKKTK
jgi:hypothetical protein